MSRLARPPRGQWPFFPSKVVEAQTNPNPPWPFHVPAPLLQSLAAADTTPASPAAARERGATSSGEARGSAPRAGPRRAAAEREGKGREGRGGPPGPRRKPHLPGVKLTARRSDRGHAKASAWEPRFPKNLQCHMVNEIFRQKTQPRGRAASQTLPPTDAHRATNPLLHRGRGCSGWGVGGVSCSFKINKTKASPRCPLPSRAYLLSILSISGLPVWVVVLFVLLFSLWGICLINAPS